MLPFETQLNSRAAAADAGRVVNGDALWFVEHGSNNGISHSSKRNRSK